MSEELVPLTEVADRFGLARRTVYDPAWRRRVGLRVVYLGGRIVGVRESDLAAALREGITRPPLTGSPKDAA